MLEQSSPDLDWEDPKVCLKFSHFYQVKFLGIAHVIGLKHVRYEYSWHWSGIVFNIKFGLCIGLVRNINQDKSWYWSQSNFNFKTSLSIGLDQHLKSIWRYP